jgi:hypothetical protein
MEDNCGGGQGLNWAVEPRGGGGGTHINYVKNDSYSNRRT